MNGSQHIHSKLEKVRTRAQKLRTIRSTATILAVALALSSTNASAISSYTSTSLSCGSIKSLILSQDAVILRWTSKNTGNPRYNRFVRNGNYCNVAQVAMPTYIPASNTSKCRVYYCAKRESNCDDRRRC